MAPVLHSPRKFKSVFHGETRKMRVTLTDEGNCVLNDVHTLFIIQINRPLYITDSFVISPVAMDNRPAMAFNRHVLPDHGGPKHKVHFGWL